MTEIEQGSEAWKLARAGKFTASRFCDVLAKKLVKGQRTGEPLKAWHDCVWDVVVERLSGRPIESVNAAALAWGTECEPLARSAYEMHSGQTVKQVGFMVHGAFPFAGASPDGLIGKDGIVEIKCPFNSRVHVERFINGVPEEYIPQVQGQLWVTGRQWCDFVSFDPRMPEPHNLLVIRVNRDDGLISDIEREVIAAEAKAVELLSRLISYAPDA